MNKYPITDEKTLREAFFLDHPEFLIQKNTNEVYDANARIAWRQYVEWCKQTGRISSDLARSVRL